MNFVSRWASSNGSEPFAKTESSHEKFHLGWDPRGSIGRAESENLGNHVGNPTETRAHARPFYL